ncbi:hypothetical protein SPICUR_01245 [Spiribacter curvatus]|uniref:N5-carboxyaminoimidazole ribonucleotide synthase n=1 Tax=Spiribacter curvatus TaxID=1335757 RepID=U5T1I1_9GAMM|nr:5-(carboxyamino)imidazole ribonucleotide synthase [Spiribacter curvatus]AGY91270.1 hypothetical protein SPICUR_01245 [Spiribacter curvatus]
MSHPILPGATVGILGSGQLGRMLAQSARRMGYRVHTLSPGADSPTGQIADREVIAAYDDQAAIARFARDVDVVTFEFENIAAESAAVAARYVPVRPRGDVLHITQNRHREKHALTAAGLPTARYEAVASLEQLHDAIGRLGTPCILKTAGFGYDGKGQVRITAETDPAAAWRMIGAGAAIVEAMVDFEAELSVVAARGVDGAQVDFGVTENRHVDHILDISVADMPLDPAQTARAHEIAGTVMREFDVVGVLCIEMFLTRDGDLLVNELAPRPHNSGHLTIEACASSQFDQQLRAVCGLPLGETARRVPTAMANLLGDHWESGEPDWAAALADPAVNLHLYGKAEPRPGRKMGHLTASAPSRDEAVRRVTQARSALLRTRNT